MLWDRHANTNEEKLLQLRSGVGTRLSLLLLVASVALLGSSALVESEASACKLAPKVSMESAQLYNVAGPEIVHSGYRAPAAIHSEDAEPTHLWLQLASVPEDAHFVIFESVWGGGPTALAGMWGKAIPIRNNHVFVYPAVNGPHRDQAFTLGVRVRFVFEDGSLSTASLPTFITNEGSAVSEGGARADQVLMALCCASLLALWIVFRRDPDPVHRIRVSAAVGLVSVLFLATSPALSWVSVEDPSGRLATVNCHLGDETQCATYAPDSGPNPLSMSDISSERRFEVARWMSASSALRIGLILCLVLLMPALVWLMVAPTLRPAQSAMAFGASAAGYTFLAAICYRLTVPSWMCVESSNAFELTMLTAGNIVVAAGMVIYWSFRHLESGKAELPEARARIRHTVR
jgi:hypothetical protein